MASDLHTKGSLSLTEKINRDKLLCLGECVFVTQMFLVCFPGGACDPCSLVLTAEQVRVLELHRDQRGWLWGHMFGGGPRRPELPALGPARPHRRQQVTARVRSAGAPPLTEPSRDRGGARSQWWGRGSVGPT